MSTLSVGTIQSNTTAPPVIRNSGNTEIGTFCRAWVNFNGTGTAVIRASFNVTSLVDNGTGDYTVNFTNAMPDVNYAGLVSCGGGSINSGAFGGSRAPTQDDPTTTAFRLRTVTETDATIDLPFVSVAFFR
jgi:hypothetical protein